MRKVVISLFILLGGVCVLLGAAFVYREDLVRYAAGRFLATGGQLTLTRLEGLELTSTRLHLAELELLLNASGQRLVVSGLGVDFRLSSLTTAPVVESVTIASAQLSAAAGEPAAGEGAGGADATSDTRLGNLLTLLREVPLAQVEVGALRLPQRRDALALELQRGEGRLDARIESGALTLRAGFVQADAAAQARFDVTLARAAATVGDLAIALQPMGDTYALSGEGMLDIPDLNALLGELEQAPLALPLRAARLEWNVAGSVADALRGNAGGGTAETFTLGFRQASTVTLPAGLAEGLGETTLAFTDAAAFTISTGAGLVVSSERVPLHVETRWKEQAATADGVLSLARCELAVNAACALGFDGNATFGPYTLAGALQVTAASGAYTVKTQGLTLGGLPDLVPAFDVDANISVDAGRIAFSTPLLLRAAPAAAGMTLAGTYDLASGAVDVSAALPALAFTEQGGALSGWFANWPYAFDVLTGSIAATLDVTWQAGVLTGTLDGTLQNLGGFYGDYFFRGVNGPLRARIDSSGTLPLDLAPTTLTVAGLDVGLPLEDLQVDFSLERTGVLHIDSFRARVLEGSVTGMDFTYDFNRDRNELLVNFSGLRMERMLDLVDYEGVEAIGAVSGQVPLTLTPTGVEVAAGTLTADAPGGSIRYLAAAAGATGNAGLDLVNQALGNYQFDSLTSAIDYKPDGELVLAMKLQGRNPDMSGGQRINLNLNLSDNVPALLESLQAARKLEDFLAEQYR